MFLLAARSSMLPSKPVHAEPVEAFTRFLIEIDEPFDKLRVNGFMRMTARRLRSMFITDQTLLHDRH